MSKKRNRNVKSLVPLTQLTFSKFPLPEDLSSDKAQSNEETDYFGEYIAEQYLPPFYKPDFGFYQSDHVLSPFYKVWNRERPPQFDITEDAEPTVPGMNDLNLLKSISSSPSWSDDNDNESSRHVQDELERMDRVLRGIEPIPLHYDIDEYKQWMETFPNINLFGHRTSGPYKIWNSENQRDLKAKSPELCDNSYASEMRQYKAEIKKAVIQNIYENLSLRLGNISSPIIKKKITKTKNKSAVESKTQSYLEECMKISPFAQSIKESQQRKHFFCRNNSQDVQGTSEALANIHLVPSKWMDDSSPEFVSLPFLLDEKNNSNSTLSSPLRDRINNDSIIKSNRIKGKFHNNVTLPPIKHNNSINQFRSISATPTYSTVLSGKSCKLENKLNSGKSRFNVTNVLLDNASTSGRLSRISRSKM